MEFRVPNMGEGIESATVVRVLVAEGAAVSEGQETVEVETDKSTFTIPAPAAGTIEKVQVKAGDKVAEGSVLMSTSAGGGSPQGNGQPAPAQKPAPPEAKEKPPSTKSAPADTAKSRQEIRIPDLGEGITSGAEQPILELETEKATLPIPSPLAGRVEEVRAQVGQTINVGDVIALIASEAAATPAATPPPPKPSRAEQRAPQPTEQAPAQEKKPAAVAELSPTRNGNHRAPVPAGPATRRLARELGVDLHQVIGSASGGRVTQDDVKAYVRGIPKGAKASPAAAGFTAPTMPDFSKYGPIERKPFTSLRKTIARNLNLSWRAFPQFNASYDANAGEYGELILKQYYHIGIAVDTERGLLVPVIRDADKKSISVLARELGELAEKARAGKLMPDDMRGGTFTISNLGGIGGTAFSPIINYPEVAILGLSRSALQPVVRDDKIEPRLMLPLSLTYDHRVIDGANGARFTARIAAAFSDPVRLLLEG